MADKKISALTAASTPLAGTEVLPIVQSGATVKVPVSDLTAGRAISATQLTLTTGNLIVASGQGIDFSATSGTGTSELLADYEEGTWTPIDSSGAGLTFTVSDNKYTKIGRQVTCTALITYPTTANVNDSIIGGLPFTIGSYAAGVAILFTIAVGNVTTISSTTTMYVRGANTGTVSNVTLSTKTIAVNITYFV